MVHVPVAYHANYAGNDSGWDANETDHPKPPFWREVHDGYPCNQESNSSAQIGHEGSFIGKECPVNGEFIPQDQIMAVKS